MIVRKHQCRADELCIHCGREMGDNHHRDCLFIMTYDKPSFDAGYEAGFKFGVRAAQRARELAAQSETTGSGANPDSRKRPIGAESA